MRTSRTAVALLVTGGAGAALLVTAAAATGLVRWPEAVPALLLELSFYVVGAVAALGGRRHRAVERLLAVGATHLASFGLALSAAWMLQEHVAGAWLVNLASTTLFLLGFAAFVGLFAVFPTGTYERGYERWATRAALTAAAALPLVQLVALPAQPLVVDVPVTTPDPVHVAGLEPLANLSALMPLLLLGGIALFVLRYRRSSPAGRAAMRWPLVSVVGGGAGALAHLVPGVPAVLAGSVVVLSLSAFPVLIAVAIRRHRLLDVDLVLRRTFAYALLWTLIALLYGVGAAAAGLAVGSRVDVQAAVVATIACAMAFSPARRRLEQLAERAVRGRRRAGYPLLRELGGRLEQQAATDDVAQAVVRTVAEGLDPRWVRLRTVGSSGLWTTAAEVGAPGEETPSLVAPLRDDEGEVGRVECGPAASGSWDDDDRDLLEALARQASLAVRRARLAADLAASRARLVQAQDAERRRLERDLHDGAQQHLVALMAALEVAQVQLEQDPRTVAATLRKAQDISRDAHRSLRELARGVRPPLLSDRGLVAAVEAQLAALPVPAQVTAEPELRGVRFAPEVEAAAYFLVTEAVTNAAKHAGPAHVVVELRADEQGLHVAVSDDGCGFDVPRQRAAGGLSGLRDRVEALGGHLLVEAARGRGTALHAVLPPQVPGG